MRRWMSLLLIVFVLLLIPGSAFAQSYSFELVQETVHVFWNADGTVSLDYVFLFNNDFGAHSIEYVDVGLPNQYVEVDSIYADVDGVPVNDISKSGYEGTGYGVAVGLGALSIPPGETGQVHVFIGTINRMLHEDTQGDQYASAVFSPSYFDPQYVHGNTDLTVIYHLPPGVQSEEPRWHSSPPGWATEPIAGFDDAGRITYMWSNAKANGHTEFIFGASFPKKYIPETTIYKPSFLESLGISGDDILGFLFFCGIVLFIVVVAVISVSSSRKRKLKYLPPKISIEGHGIKRGLTAIEAAILMEKPMDKILTMILFALIKKGAAQVISRDPLKLEETKTQPENLRPYEIGFLEAFRKTKKSTQQRALQRMMIDLVKSLSKKMKGFSRKETVGYYRDIIKRAWAQVEAADTPEVKSQKFNDFMEWTMLDRDYEDRTRDVFRTGPVFVPVWWGHYDPTYRSSPVQTSTPTPSGTTPSLPHLPGSDFAASFVNGIQDFSSNAVGNLTDFTSKITNKTNPVPISSSGGRSSSGGCACACACAGCACACAGGGR